MLANLVLDAPLVVRVLVRLDVGVHWPDVFASMSSLSNQRLACRCERILDISFALAGASPPVDDCLQFELVYVKQLSTTHSRWQPTHLYLTSGSTMGTPASATGCALDRKL